jgi:predicted short-subunit dehydrogenase-like oxidoreductase (DUF2520 family)
MSYERAKRQPTWWAGAAGHVPLGVGLEVNLGPTIALIVGRGRLGLSLAGALRSSKIEVIETRGRTPNPSLSDIARVNLVVIAVPDREIEATAEELSTFAFQTETEFIHVSGALGLDVLAPFSRAGFSCGSFHPFQPFPQVRPPDSFHGASIGITASDQPLLERLADIANRIGAVPRIVQEDRRDVYHTAAVLASACVVALAGQAIALLEDVGWDTDAARSAIVALMEGTVGNIADDGVPDALSGPMRRGDADTIARHLSALKRLAEADRDTTTLLSYTALSRAALSHAESLGLHTDNVARLEELLDAAVASEPVATSMRPMSNVRTAGDE